MGNVRVFGLARDLNLSSQEVIDRLKKLGVEVKTASSSVDEDTADKLRRILKIDALTAKKSIAWVPYLGSSLAYTVCYVGAALAVALCLFEDRELG